LNVVVLAVTLARHIHVAHRNSVRIDHARVATVQKHVAQVDDPVHVMRDRRAAVANWQLEKWTVKGNFPRIPGRSRRGSPQVFQGSAWSWRHRRQIIIGEAMPERTGPPVLPLIVSPPNHHPSPSTTPDETRPLRQ